MKTCLATFQQKSDYYRHWRKKHNNMIIPDGFDYVEEEKKTCRRKIHRQKNEQTVELSRPNDFQVLDYLGLVETSAVNIQVLLNFGGPFFGKFE